MFINLRDFIQQTDTNPSGDLVTRHTGKVVRSGIEEHLQASDQARVAIIDFSEVRCLDISCADEIVGKLLVSHGRSRYFLLRGLRPGHLEALEPVLEQHRIAVVSHDQTGRVKLLGPIPETARQAFEAIAESGVSSEDDLVRRLDLAPAQARSALDHLLTLRVVEAGASGYRPISAS